MPKRLSVSEVRIFVESRGCKLINITYKNNHTPLDFICKCGNTFSTTFNEFKEQNRDICPDCRGYKKQTIDEVRTFIGSLGGELLSVDYAGQLEKLDILCSCGNKFKRNYKDIRTTNSATCRQCMYKQQSLLLSKGKDKFKEEIRNLVGSEYELVGEYVNTNSKTTFKHNICGKEYDAMPSAFINGRRCPYCFETNGEGILRNVLNELNLNFSHQVTFSDLLGEGGKPLRFDFGIFNNNKIHTLIEYDGIYHFEPISHGNNKKEAIERLERQQRYDNIKNIYCKVNNIRLIRIPYWQIDEIKEIIYKNLM